MQLKHTVVHSNQKLEKWIFVVFFPDRDNLLLPAIHLIQIFTAVHSSADEVPIPRV